MRLVMRCRRCGRTWSTMATRCESAALSLAPGSRSLYCRRPSDTGLTRAAVVPVASPCLRWRSAPTPPPPRSAAAAMRRPTALRERRGGLRRNDFGEGGSDRALDCWIGRVDGTGDRAAAADRSRSWECRNNRLAWLALQQDGHARGGRAKRARATAPTASRSCVGTSTSSIGATEEAYARLQDDGDGVPAFPGRPARARSCTRRIRSAISCSTPPACAGPCITVATACSSSAKVFAQAARLIQAGRGRCRAGRRRRYAVRQRAVRLQRARPGLGGAVPAVRCARAMACRSAKPAVSRCSNASTTARRPACSCAATANPATRTTCPRRIPKAWARAWRWAMRWRAPASTPADSRLSQPARHRDAGQRRDRSARRRRAVPRHAACQFDQGLDRAHARRGRHRRIGVRAARAGTRRAARHPQQRRSATIPPAARRSVSTTRNATIRYAMNNSFGFGGNNCSLVFGAHDHAVGHRRRHRLLEQRPAGSWHAARALRARRRAARGAPARRRRNCSRRTSAAARRTPSRSRWKSRWPPAPTPAAIRRRCRRCSPPRTAIWRITDYMCATLAQPTRARSRRRASTTRCTTPPPATGPSAAAACEATTAISALRRELRRKACSKRSLQLADRRRSGAAGRLRQRAPRARWRRSRNSAGLLGGALVLSRARKADAPRIDATLQRRRHARRRRRAVRHRRRQRDGADAAAVRSAGRCAIGRRDCSTPDPGACCGWSIAHD